MHLCAYIPDKKKKKKKKRNAYSRFFHFSERDKIFQLFRLYRSVAQSSPSLCPKMHLIWSRTESVISLEVTEGSKSNVTNGSISSMVTISTQTYCTPSTQPTKRNTCSKVFTYNLPILSVKSPPIISSTVYSLSGANGDHTSC